ncbi:MAG: hypothetical protein ACREAW_05735 [Nitrososphaera sp.]
MHPDDLKTMWLCCECGRKFVFHSDVEDHKVHLNHSKMMICDLAGSRKAPELFTRGRISLGFRLNGRPACVVVEYEYHPSSDAIRYVDVKYSDSRLRSMVEGDPAMMKNIDNYLRKLLKPGTPVRL